MIKNLIDSGKAYHHKYEKRIEVLLFVGGFLFDALMVKEPDELIAIIQQVIYLFVIAAILHFELLFSLQKWQPSEPTQKLWKYREYVQPFLLGTLLNVYSIFYIKSASFFSSLIFLLIMIGLIILNENPSVKKSRVSFKVGLFGICVFSFFSILYPIVLGFLGLVPFLLAAVTTAGVFFLQFFLLQKKLADQSLALKAVVVPGISVLVFFVIFYIFGWIPPVPLSVKEQGIYHLIEKKAGAYYLSTEKEWWRFWNSSDENFKAQPGDKIYFYFQVYSPTRFDDEVMVHWLWKDHKGKWESADRIPVKILGGRKEGFRGFTFKNMIQPGSWRVQVESRGGLEISRLYLEVTNVDATAAGSEARQFNVLVR